MKKTGIELIQEERARQVAKGYNEEHDDGESAFQLSTAAGHYIANAQNKNFKDHSHNDGTALARFQIRNFETDKWSQEWPWKDKDGRKNADVMTSLIKAGALIAAEIDRLLKDQE